MSFLSLGVVCGVVSLREWHRGGAPQQHASRGNVAVLPKQPVAVAAQAAHDVGGGGGRPDR
jgi:hypothetical protein